MNEEKIKNLLERYSKNLCSPEERKYIERNILKKPILDKWEWTGTAHKKRIEQRIRKGLPMLENTATSQGKRLKYVLVAAAVTLLYLGIWTIAGYQGQSRIIIAEASSEDKQQTTLTFPDGKSLTINDKICIKDIETILSETGQTNKDAWLTIHVPNGRTQEVILADGSSVWLNAGSTFRFPYMFPHNHRHVQMEGEGYFNIEHDPARPFHVFVEKGEIVVTGTIFNVQAYQDQKYIRTSLIEGGIDFHMDQQKHQLTPGNELLADISHGETKLQKFDIDQIRSWKEGYFKFDNTDLIDVLKMVSRWYNVTIISNVELLNKPIGGTFPNDAPLEELLHDLSTVSKVNFEIQGKEVLIVK